MKVMNHTEEQQTENKTSLSNGAKRNRIFIYIAIAGVIAAVITAAFTGYYLHQERAEEKKQEELLKAEKAKKQKEKKAKTTETAEQKLERVRSCHTGRSASTGRYDPRSIRCISPAFIPL